MHTLLLRFEAIESRLSSYSCPRGAPGRVHSLRLPRCFRSIPRAYSPASDQASLQYYDAYIPPPIEPSASQSHAIQDTSESPKELVESKPPRVTINNTYLWETVPRHSRLRYRGIRRSILARDMVPTVSTKTPAEIVAEEEANLHDGLRKGNAHPVMRSLMNIAQLEGHGYSTSMLVSAPPPTFSEILRCIDPKHFVDPYAAVFRQISPVSTQLLGGGAILGPDDYYEFCTAFIAQAGKIIGARRQRWPLSVSDYKYLLKCAKAVGHAKAAESIWKAMLTPRYQEREVIPDVEAFNHYLAVKCWQDKMIPKHRYRLRVIEENFTPRSWLIPPHTLNSHRVGPNQGIKSQASILFRHMVEIGVTGNEETFCLMMIALGREGDLKGIASILGRVWNINVEALMADEPEVEPTTYSPRSPFFPSNHLLYSIAHAYGSNNEISTALRLLDFVSRHYSISISLNVWNELLQWTSIVSIKKRLIRKNKNEEKPTGREAGQLPPAAVSNLWQTMTSEPYNVKPTIQMYDRLISNLAYRQRYGEMQIRMEEARIVLKQEILLLSRKEASYLAILGRSKESIIEARARDLIYARFRIWRNRQYVKRWIRLLFRGGSMRLRFNDDFTARNIPNIVENWAVFLPRTLKYRTATGGVSFVTNSLALKKWRSGMLAKRAKWQAKRVALWRTIEDFESEGKPEPE